MYGQLKDCKIPAHVHSFLDFERQPLLLPIEYACPVRMWASTA